MKDTLKMMMAGLVIFIILLTAYVVGQNRLPSLKYCNARYAMDEKFRPSTWEPIGWDLSEFPRQDCPMPEDKIVHADGTWEWK